MIVKKKAKKGSSKKRPVAAIFKDQCSGIRKSIEDVQDEIDSLDQILNDPNVPQRVKGPFRRRKRILVSLLRSLKVSLQRCLAAL